MARSRKSSDRPDAESPEVEVPGGETAVPEAETPDPENAPPSAAPESSDPVPEDAETAAEAQPDEAGSDGPAPDHASDQQAKVDDAEGGAVDGEEVDTARTEADELDIDTPSEDAPPGELDPEAVDEVEPVSDAPAKPAPAPRPEPEPSSGFVPMVLGGVLAAAAGFGIARYAVPEGWPTPEVPDQTVTAALEAQAERLTGLETQLEGLAGTIATLPEMPEIPAMPDTDALAETLRGERDEALSGLAERVDALAAELADLAARPSAPPGDTGALSEDRVAEFQAALDAALAEARSDMAGAVAEAEAQMRAAQEAAADAEADAERAAETATARAALERLRAALEAGTPYADALEPIRAAGAEIPGALADAADTGLPTLLQLQESFPHAARAALDAAIRSEAPDAPVDRALAFLRTQTGARSLIPRDGDDPDAILSRAEAALRSGDLDTALAEVEALPEAGQSAMANWTAQAETRTRAVAAVPGLAQSIDGS